MAVDMFLDIEGEIEGESQDAEHERSIDVLAWSWGLSQSGSFHVGGGGGAGLGHWCLMASGNWNSPDSPAHMSAWAKAQLGWVDVIDVHAHRIIVADAIKNEACDLAWLLNGVAWNFEIGTE